ncbi:MAG: magnesium/cobalt transporter CorA [Elusimicrobia bacterium]|nr:magnesium/cobalt transporter CorA [Elusimicrobiota bacterium]
MELGKRFNKGSQKGAGITPEELSKLPSGPGKSRVACIDYSKDQVKVTEVTDLKEFLASHRPEWTSVRWINVDGLDDMDVVRHLADKYQLHPLAIEDVLHRPQRPKVDAYAGDAPVAGKDPQARLFIIARMLRLLSEGLRDEQISIFLGHSTVLTLQEYADGDVWDAVRQRLKTAGSRVRQHDASFLVYSLLDAIVDQCFPILEHYGDRLEDLEGRILRRPGQKDFEAVHRLKRELLLVRRCVWPMREVINTLQREEHECLSDETRTYLRDVGDHAMQIIDILETYREVAVGLSETYMTALSNRLNEIMKVLTMINVFFIPITFLSSVFGMNFTKFPWDHAHAFPAFGAACVAITIAMIVWFRRRGWL